MFMVRAGAKPMSSVSVRLGIGRAPQRPVVGLGAAAGEVDFPGLRRLGVGLGLKLGLGLGLGLQLMLGRELRLGLGLGLRLGLVLVLGLC